MECDIAYRTKCSQELSSPCTVPGRVCYNEKYIKFVFPVNTWMVCARNLNLEYIILADACDDDMGNLH